MKTETIERVLTWLIIICVGWALVLFLYGRSNFTYNYHIYNTSTGESIYYYQDDVELTKVELNNMTLLFNENDDLVYEGESKHTVIDMNIDSGSNGYAMVLILLFCVVVAISICFIISILYELWLLSRG